MKFHLYETALQSTESTLLASILMSVTQTLVTYPFDLYSGRMAADLSKKATIFKNKNLKDSYDKKSHKLYTSTYDCFSKNLDKKSYVQSIKN